MTGARIDLDDPLLSGLNPEQAAAVIHGEGPLLVLAGAGTGKTRVITHRIAWLIKHHGVAPWQILAVTFSNKAAGEMRHRIQELLGDVAADLWLGTFHSIGVRLLRRIGQHAGLDRSFTIYDRDDQLRMIKRTMKALDISDKAFRPRAIASYIDQAKNACLLADDPRLQLRDIQERASARVYSRYEADMRTANAVDFGDLLMRPVQILTAEPVLREQYSHRFRHVLVDEFQDTNAAQYALLNLLSASHGNMCVVGDDDQSIYSWRGAEISNILDFPQAHAGTKVVRLERNYRSSANILAASSAVVARNRSRHTKTLWTEREGGPQIGMFEASSDRDEADWVARRIEALRRDHPLGEFAVFYRTNAQSRQLEESMNRYRLPYVLIGGLRFYERAEVKDLLAYLRLAVNEHDGAGWLRIVNTPRRGIGAATVARVEAISRRDDLSIPAAARALLAGGEKFRSRGKLAAFCALIDTMRGQARDSAAHRAGAAILKASGMRDALLAEGTPDAETRLENLGQLLAAMTEHADTADDPTLAGFLEQVALVADVDQLANRREAVALMTMHAAKGLEYDVAFVVGLEDGLIPHENSLREGGDEEERRLLYVAMTRARKHLHLSHARMRNRFGRDELATPSAFLRDVPAELLDAERQATPTWAAAGAGWSGGWNQRPRAWAGAGAAKNPSVAKLRNDAMQAAAARQRRAGADDDMAVDAEPTSQGETVIERQPADGLNIGDRVRHVRFGTGEVMDVAGYGEMARVTVHFGRVGVKKLVARFLQRT